MKEISKKVRNSASRLRLALEDLAANSCEYRQQATRLKREYAEKAETIVSAIEQSKADIFSAAVELKVIETEFQRSDELDALRSLSISLRSVASELDSVREWEFDTPRIETLSDALKTITSDFDYDADAIEHQKVMEQDRLLSEKERRIMGDGN